MSCATWEEISGFRSPGEYERFKRWIDERVAEGTAERVPVKKGWRYANPLFEDWFRCRETGDVWSLMHPDPPTTGGFTRVEL
jgi:hypothetical protein